MKKFKKSQKAISLILTLLVLSSILTGTILVGETIIRHSQVVQGTEISEKAFFAAETALEKACYKVFKNYDDISLFSLSGTMSDTESDYSATVSADTNCPTPGAGCADGSITNGNPWTITLEANESFQLDIDIDGAVYPASIEIRRLGSTGTDIIVYECTTTEGTPRVCSSTVSQSFSITFPYTFTISDYATKYYKLRINNLGDSPESYILTPTGDLPIGIEINANGTYSGYERKVKSNVPKWQKYGI